MTALSDVFPLWGAPVTHRFGLAMAMDTTPYSADLRHAIEQSAAAAGCAVTCTDTGHRVADERAAVRALLAQGIDGLLLTPTAGDDGVINELVQLGTPTVLVDRMSARGDVDQVGAENIDATGELVRHLAEHGHRRIGFVAGLPGVATEDERALGFRLGMAQAGLRWNADLVACGKCTAGGAAEAVGQLLDRPAAPTALVVAGQTMMVGARYELHRRGLPDFPVVGYGELTWTRDVTVMAPPVTEIGRRAVDLLLARIAHPERPPRAVRLAPRLLCAASCGC
ncbi:LacI family transcriptional regulator [Amycolatopsis arida]|uniref:LacI family transcriptional regulator n=1 Tax=Amycolatopsis arida TaxID=587909 RepID=A0A1I5T679_9PSEU|nr:substrate-binding domain-containing protein [Amycolatopsis arida]TDX96214.1 LacI family transcriptional regulator [Amycolatopsis arida]SFP78552.1 LacI family transcriptional regulator [Amycolatopsis arida]